jgi:CheY-like chemotaxis protein
LPEASTVVLLVEDDAAHATLVLRCLEDHRISNCVNHVSDGEQALDYLFRRGTFSDAEKSPRPDVILLDLRLPKIDGLDVLTEIKKSEDLFRIPVVILSTSNAKRDIVAAYDAYANSYIVKPIDFGLFTQMMRDWGHYWLSWNQNPNESRNSTDRIV